MDRSTGQLARSPREEIRYMMYWRYCHLQLSLVTPTVARLPPRSPKTAAAKVSWRCCNLLTSASGASVLMLSSKRLAVVRVVDIDYSNCRWPLWLTWLICCHDNEVWSGHKVSICLHVCTWCLRTTVVGPHLSVTYLCTVLGPHLRSDLFLLCSALCSPNIASQVSVLTAQWFVCVHLDYQQCQIHIS